MRSRSSYSISSQQVHQWTLHWTIAALKFKDHGWKCTAVCVWSIVLRAASLMASIRAACRDLSAAPSDQAVFNALEANLPKTLKVLEERLNGALTGQLPRRLRRRSWSVAMDWHEVPYYGQPLRSRNELAYGKPQRGTTKFHTYATACLVSHGVRYTLALTWVRRHESKETVLNRLLTQLRQKSLKIRYLLLDRAFFGVPVTGFLQQQQIPFLMPTVLRGRPPKRGQKATGLRWIKRQKAGWYSHTLKNGKRKVTLSVCVAYRSHKNRKDGKRKSQKLMFAAWRVRGMPTEIREMYRKRFGIETSYRQWRQARIYTCTRDPHLRLVFFFIGLMLRNVWLWIHETYLAKNMGEHGTLNLERLRFRRMLNWIALEVIILFHDSSMPCVTT